MTNKTYRIELTDDPIQPIVVPSGAQFLYAVRWPDKPLEMYFLGNDLGDPMSMVIEQVHDNATVTENSIRHIGSTGGIHKAKFTTTHLFEVFP